MRVMQLGTQTDQHLATPQTPKVFAEVRVYQQKDKQVIQIYIYLLLTQKDITADSIGRRSSSTYPSALVFESTVDSALCSSISKMDPSRLASSQKYCGWICLGWMGFLSVTPMTYSWFSGSIRWAYLLSNFKCITSFRFAFYWSLPSSIVEFISI